MVSRRLFFMLILMLCSLNTAWAMTVGHKPAAHHVTPHAALHTGSLKTNILRLAKQYGWAQVVWNVRDDYRWVGDTRIAAHGLPSVLRQLLQHYPLQAVFYSGNHVLVINPLTAKSLV